MMIPVSERESHALYLFEKEAGEMERRSVTPVRFVPMTGEAQKR